jgi:hypothetical protein
MQNKIKRFLFALFALASLLSSAQDTYAPVTLTNAVTLTNKTITSRTVTVVSSATVTINADVTDMYIITSQSVALTFAVPTGTPKNGTRFIIRIKDNGTGRALTFIQTTGGFRFSSDLPAPTTTVAGKTYYLYGVWNNEDSFYDVLSGLGNF